ncbi:terminase small subunit [Sphingobium sp. AN558]|uniref:terminase small subunit n=1 Tax=Sphingobium sp. AN558 TaxID=3133442 RepID=UPI0030C43B4B
MTPKQQRFVEEYLIDLNATQAAIRAGYSAKTANEQASRLLANVSVSHAIMEAQQRRSTRTEITQDRVLAELAKIGFADMRKLLRWTGNLPKMDMEGAEESGDVTISVANFVQLFDSDDLDDDTAACISEISQTKDGALKVKLHDKRAALEAIGRHLGMFKDRVEHTGKDGGPIQYDQVKSDADAFESAIARLASAGGAPSVPGDTQH